MSNTFKLYPTALSTTSETTILTVPTGSNYLVGSIIIANTASATDSTITLTITDSSQSLDFNILTLEPYNRLISREVLSRTLVLENGDSIKMTAANANVFDIFVSYLDRAR